MRGPHDHLNASDPLRIPLPLDDLADRVLRMPHGAPRLLAALSRALRRRGHEADRALLEDLECLLGVRPAPTPPGTTPQRGMIFRNRFGPFKRVKVLEVNPEGTCDYQYITTDGRQDFRRRAVITGYLKPEDWEPEVVPAVARWSEASP